MSDADFSLPTAFCPQCDCLALVAGPPNGRRFQCLDCDTWIAGPAEWVTLSEAQDLGYLVPGAPVVGQKRGCRGGSCGVQQPPS